MSPGVEELIVGATSAMAGNVALSIAELYDEVEGALVRTFPRTRALWVRGEVQSLSDRTGHCYMDLVDPESAGARQAPTWKVKCWKTTWGPLKATLAREGIDLQPGMVVALRGSLDFYRPRSEIGFILAELDVTALLGRMAAERAALLRALAAEGLLKANSERPLPDVPLRVGLIGSPGTEGFADFLGQLDGSALAFDVRVVRAAVQGPGAAREVARALDYLAATDCDVVVIVRGGGSKADLAAFDSEPVARAIASSAVPVWTGIGHTGDESVADIVANRSFITPTECGRELALVVGNWWVEGAHAGAVIGRRAADTLADAERRDATARQRLTSTARHQLAAHRNRLEQRASYLARSAPTSLVGLERHLTERSARLGPLARSHVGRAEDRLVGVRQLLRAYDIERQLERGYSLTTDADGHVVRTVAGLRPGDRLLTRFADGSTASVVDEVTKTPSAPTSEKPHRDKEQE